MEIDLRAALRRRTDEELVAMIEREHGDFTSEALDAARAELRARGVGWVEPEGPTASRAAATSAPITPLTVLGVVLVVVALATLLVGGVSLQSLAMLIPGAGILLRRAVVRR